MNFIAAAKGSDRVTRTRGKYKVVDLTAEELDEVFKRYGVELRYSSDQRTPYYLVEDLRKAYQQLLQDYQSGAA